MIPAILIFDVGKTNKKVLLFDEQYKLLHEEATQLEETFDEDGFPCEDVEALTKWIQDKFSEILLRKGVDVKAVNFSAYGASFVNIDNKGEVLTPLYNYLKPYPENLKKQFYDSYGGEDLIARETASPVLGSLNSGMQLYRLKYENPEIFKQTAYSLHLPQYLSYVIADYPASEKTSMGCHTMLWDFKYDRLSFWVVSERIYKLPPILLSSSVIPTTFLNKEVQVGIGLHDSSAALIPYLFSFEQPFILISTGTWNISLNPFNHKELTKKELKQDCLCYLSYDGGHVKASRLFAGYEHEQQVKRLAAHFNKAAETYLEINYDPSMINTSEITEDITPFSETDLSDFKSFEEAYHHLIWNIIRQQVKSTSLILKSKRRIKKIFVDGGFSKNKIFMNMLANAFSYLEVYAAIIPQASALGAALAIHESWNKKPIPLSLIELTFYPNREINHTI